MDGNLAMANKFTETPEGRADEFVKKTKKIPIIAGMEFQYPGIYSMKLYEVGYKIVEFLYTHEGRLIYEYEKKRVFYSNARAKKESLK
jgi:hypothetical protein